MNGPGVLFLDIETRPPLVWTWGLFKQNIGINQVKEPGQTMGFGAKWRGKPTVLWYSDHHDGHQAMVQKAWDLLDRADIVVHYNGTSFDIPHLKTEFILAEMPPPSPFAQVDLLKAVRKEANFLSNKLDFVSQQLDIGAKVAHEGFGLWKACMEGDAKAWSRMRTYCKGDVRLTEQLYDRLLPWIPGHPHIGLYTGDLTESCQNCGGTDLQRRGLARTALGNFQQYRCNTCGRWSRSARRIEGVDVRGVSA